ncbi:hypothetical protein AB1Y20_008724 [Prymnesium parvum]|uniref:Proteophosphoglycan ppg4 n=1 Tax=Prymnesium parvum TaxID=97485 RepID=A0AB34IRZ8_PRYPA
MAPRPLSSFSSRLVRDDVSLASATTSEPATRSSPTPTTPAGLCFNLPPTPDSPDVFGTFSLASFADDDGSQHDSPSRETPSFSSPLQPINLFASSALRTPLSRTPPPAPAAAPSPQIVMLPAFRNTTPPHRASTPPHAARSEGAWGGEAQTGREMEVEEATRPSCSPPSAAVQDEDVAEVGNDREASVPPPLPSDVTSEECASHEAQEKPHFPHEVESTPPKDAHHPLEEGRPSPDERRSLGASCGVELISRSPATQFVPPSLKHKPVLQLPIAKKLPPNGLPRLQPRPRLPASRQSQTARALCASPALAIHTAPSSEQKVVCFKRPATLGTEDASAKTCRLSTSFGTLAGSTSSKAQPRGAPLLFCPTKANAPSLAPRSSPQRAASLTPPAFAREARAPMRVPPEEVAKYAREQLPALNRMKQTLEGMSVAFARMANDLLLTVWDPELEYGILTLEMQLFDVMKEEAALDTLEAQGPSESDLAKLASPA